MLSTDYIDNPSISSVISSFTDRSFLRSCINIPRPIINLDKVFENDFNTIKNTSYSLQNTYSYTINGFDIDRENIRNIQQEINTTISSLDISNYEDQILTEFINPYTSEDSTYNYMKQNTVVNSPSLYISYAHAIRMQLETNSCGIEYFFNFLHQSHRGFAGLRLNHSGTTIKFVHYGVDETPKLRTDKEKKDEPFLALDILNYTHNDIAKLLKKSSYLKTIEKIGINKESSDQEIACKLSQFKTTERFAAHDPTVNHRIMIKEAAMSEDETILVTYKGISLAYDTKLYKNTNIKNNKYYSEKYNINNFGRLIKNHKTTMINRRKIRYFFERVRHSEGRILLTCFAIAGFGDLVNFQMLYHAIITKYPKMKTRIDAYAHFYRYSISNSVIEKLLDPDITIVTHNNANRQWDPNYSYKLVKEAFKYKVKPTFEIQYNVGSVYHSVNMGNILRIGEIGGMAGVTEVEDALFTGLSRGGIGFGIPTIQSFEHHPGIISLIHNIYQAVTGNTTKNEKIEKVIYDHFGLMMARENSKVINQKPYYSHDPEDIQEGLNLSVGKRISASIIKSMITQSEKEDPIIIITGKVQILKKQAKKIGLEITEKGKLNGYKLYQARSNDYQGYLVEGFFDNKFIHLIMKYTSIPIVFSGEGSLNEGLSFLKNGFMIPFYDYQITTLIESSGIESHELYLENDFILDDSELQENKIIKIQLKHSSILSLQQYDCIKIAINNEDPQLYLIVDKDNQQVILKKLDRTDLKFKLIFLPSLRLSQQKLSIQVYKLKGWAKEWLKIIYDRNINNIDLNKLGQQAPSLLQSQKEIEGSWFNLL